MRRTSSLSRACTFASTSRSSSATSRCNRWIVVSAQHSVWTEGKGSNVNVHVSVCLWLCVYGCVCVCVCLCVQERKECAGTCMQGSNCLVDPNLGLWSPRAVICILEPSSPCLQAAAQGRCSSASAASPPPPSHVHAAMMAWDLLTWRSSTAKVTPTEPSRLSILLVRVCTRVSLSVRVCLSVCVCLCVCVCLESQESKATVRCPVGVC